MMASPPPRTEMRTEELSLPDRRALHFSIGMIAPCPFPTGQGTQVLIRHLATALTQAGHSVHLVTYGYGESQMPLLFNHHRAKQIAPRHLRSGPGLYRAAEDASLFATARRVLQKYRCDLIHAHNIEGLFLGLALRRCTGLPLVYHAHNTMFTELPTYFRRRWAKRLATQVGDYVDRKFPRRADAIIAFDEDQKALFELAGMSTERVHVIPPGLYAAELEDVESESLAALARDLGNGPWLLYAGNPDSYQNLPLLWGGYKLVRTKRSDIGLLVVSTHSAAAFADEYQAAGAPDGVRFIQCTDRNALRNYYHLACLGLCTRTVWAGAPIKVLNYLAAGLPVVAVRSASRHVIAHGAGRLIEPTPQALADAVLKELAAANRRRRPRGVFKRFEITSHMPLYEAVYGRLTGGATARA
jgi:glycosyltransferase involved in cell wall biosynthesis